MCNDIMKVDQLYSLVWMSRPLMQAAEVVVEQGLRDTGLTVRMRAVLEVLHAHGDLTVPDLAHNLEIKRQYVQLMVNETLVAGLTAQRHNPRHKRSQLLTLTDSGRLLIARIVEDERALIAALGASIDPEDAQTALNVVVHLIEKLKSHAGMEYK